MCRSRESEPYSASASTQAQGTPAPRAAAISSSAGDPRLCRERDGFGNLHAATACLIARPGSRGDTACGRSTPGRTGWHKRAGLHKRERHRSGSSRSRPAVPESCRATPTECSPFLRNPVSSTTNTRTDHRARQSPLFVPDRAEHRHPMNCGRAAIASDRAGSAPPAPPFANPSCAKCRTAGHQ